MDINIIEEKGLKSIYPNNSKVSIEEMEAQEKEKYFKLYNMYRKLYTEYLISKLDLKKYDKAIEEDGLKFVAVLPQDMDVYQYFSCKELKYFYIRNNIYVERLNDEERNFFENKIDSNNWELDEETAKIIENSYKRMTYEGMLDDGKRYITLFGPNNRKFLAPSENIIVGFRYDEFIDDGLEDAMWKIRNSKQRKYIDDLIESMNTSYKQNLEDNIKIIKYSQFSVAKMKN